jgi:hypothetical protein
MARTKRIAPTLRSVIEWPVPERFIAPGGNGAVAAVHVHVQAKAELRALLAVARAADEIRPAVVGLLAAVETLKALRGGKGRVEAPPQLARLDRALDRLSRASQPKGGDR